MVKVILICLLLTSYATKPIPQKPKAVKIQIKNHTYWAFSGDYPALIHGKNCICLTKFREN